MSTRWREMRLGDFVSLQRGHDLPTQDRRPGNVPILGSFGVTGHHDTPRTRGPGVTVGRSGASFGVVTFCPVDYWPLNTALYVTDFHGNDPRFAYYFLKSIDFSSFNSGSAQPSLNRNFIHPIRVRIPEIAEQRRIADILGTLDDKIELNRRMNETLEAMARALFKSWFVDFDPVHAKAAVRREHPKWSNAQVSRAALPNLDPGVAELFPDSFEDSTTGPIPAGWRAGTVPEAIDVNPLRSLPKNTVSPYLEMSNMPTRSARAAAWEDRPFGSGTKFINGDTLVARITPCLENGKTAYVDFLRDGQVGAGSTEYIVLRPKPPLPTTFAYYLARSQDFRQHLITNMTGTSGRQRAPADCLNSYHIVSPPEPVAARFGEFTERGFRQMKANDDKSRDLATVRDSLLPRLLAGQLALTECHP